VEAGFQTKCDALVGFVAFEKCVESANDKLFGVKENVVAHDLQENILTLVLDNRVQVEVLRLDQSFEIRQVLSEQRVLVREKLQEFFNIGLRCCHFIADVRPLRQSALDTPFFGKGCPMELNLFWLREKLVRNHLGLCKTVIAGSSVAIFFTLSD